LTDAAAAQGPTGIPILNIVLRSASRVRAGTVDPDDLAGSLDYVKGRVARWGQVPDLVGPTLEVLEEMKNAGHDENIPAVMVAAARLKELAGMVERQWDPHASRLNVVSEDANFSTTVAERPPLPRHLQHLLEAVYGYMNNPRDHGRARTAMSGMVKKI